MINFPSALTEEEEFLKQKYAKLRKKKKALQAMRIAKPESQTVNTPPVKRPSESSADALEHAKRLLKSGAIKLNNENKDKQSFKRSKNFEKKLKDPDKTPSTVGFQPFSATHPDSQEKEEEKEVVKPRRKGLSESFVMEGGMRDTRYDRDREERSDNPRKGNTIYVYGHKVTEELLRKAFENIGPIVNVTMELERNCGFVTFEKVEFAEQAIAMVNGCMISDVQLKVSMARRQPSFNQPQEQASSQSPSWGTIAASSTVSLANYKEKRGLVSYEDLF
ncbi:negative elongation factor E isoform X1 [Octopus sinensis]|uniref:Negative elongation factor E n=1 Tax=Octopus sinensis TaxID=2607531 RepID=A0A6P7TV53_9MOLL|nr:negative elongation factor E isoform X1 [Octopus sinensis]